MDTKKSIKGTKTEKNIINAFVSESTAYARYTYYAQKADTEEYFPIGVIFRETADNELRHCKVFFKMLEGGTVNCNIPVDAGIIGTTLQNLEIAAEEERTEGVEQYMAAAKVAEDEGFPEIALHFKSIASIEKIHMERFKRYIKQVKEGTVWKRDREITWKCLVCGYQYRGTTPLVVCPACDHPQKHYMALDIYDD